MKLHIHNFGKIASAEIPLAPLTVFIGPNNTNKTWTAYALYGIMQAIAYPYSLFPSSSADPFTNVDLTPPLKENINRETVRAVHSIRQGFHVEKAETVTIEIRRDALVAGVSYPIRATMAATALQEFLVLKDPLPQNAAVTLELDEVDMHVFSESVIFSARRIASGPIEISSQFLAPGTGASVVQRRQQVDATNIHSSEFFPETKLLALGRRASTLVFPAERISLTSFGRPPRAPMFSPQMLLLSRPVLDFILFLERLSYFVPKMPHEMDAAQRPIRSFLEQRILGGKIGYGGPEGSNRNIEFEFHAGQTLRIHSASSLVKSLASLDLYLAGGFARAGDLVVIDEPEMNAHPQAQIAIAEMLAIMVNLGINVVVTTHSPYIVDQLNNLIAASAVPVERREAVVKKLALQSPDAIINPDKVKVYFFGDDGHVRPTFDPESGAFELSTYSDVSDRLANLYSEILEVAREH